MTEYLYDQSSLLITFVLLVLMALALEAGYRLGRRPRTVAPEATLQQIDTVQSSLLGILALMLGFTFAIALERFNSRADAVRAEAGAIGTAWQRADLLPPSVQDASRRALRDYLAVRATTVSLAHPEQAARDAATARATALQDRLWALAVQASQAAPHPATTGLYLQALDEVFGGYAGTVDVTARHVPELVLLLLYASFIATGGVIGFSAALRGQRPSRAVYLMTGLIVLMMFVVMDLDRPRRGIIQVNPAPLLELRDSLAAARQGGDSATAVAGATSTARTPPGMEASGSDPAAARPLVVGGDRDAHGCLGSAGYSWCGKESRCERPWELAQARGFANSAEAFRAYCALP